MFGRNKKKFDFSRLSFDSRNSQKIALKNVQDSFWCELARKAKNSCSVSPRGTVSTGSLIFFTDSLTHVALGLILVVGKMYLEKIC